MAEPTHDESREADERVIARGHALQVATERTFAAVDRGVGKDSLRCIEGAHNRQIHALNRHVAEGERSDMGIVAKRQGQ
jgi:hypothetical protein